jgi:hypothetical protein
MRYRIALTIWLLLRLAIPTEVLAQGGSMGGMSMGNAAADHAVHEAMAGPMSASPHMKMTPTRPRTVADSVRAMAVADTLRRALMKYADPSAAESDGFKLFAPQVKDQKVYHYTKWTNALGERFRFNPAKPTSILYKKDAMGHMKLVGAMYTMPKRTSSSDLDKRVPLSVTAWHLHTNLCAPAKGQEARMAEVKDGKPLFGLNGTIVTKADCVAAGGRWWDTLFGWMVHANVFEGTDLATVWGHDEHDDHGKHGI